MLRVRGYALPEGEPVDLYADGDRWTADPVAGAELAGEGWLLPGLVDAHTHPGADAPGDPLSEELLRSDLRDQIAAGVTLIRAPGLAGDPPDWFGRDSDLPRAVHAGPWIAQHGQFFDGWGRRADHHDLPALAAAQAARTGWAKVIADWRPGHEAIPAGVLAAAVAAVHAAGGRIAVHAQHAAGCEAAVAAGVDSLEHGMCLDPALLTQMAAQNTALTPTLTVITENLQYASKWPDPARKAWYLPGAQAHPQLTAMAAEAGVTILAGTDSRPHGKIAAEIRALAAAGLTSHDALAAGSWTARSYLGLGGLAPGAPADAVIYGTDPRADLAQLDQPHAVVLRGRLVYPQVASSCQRPSPLLTYGEGGGWPWSPAGPPKADRSRSCCCTDRSERISSIGSPSNALATCIDRGIGTEQDERRVPGRQIGLDRLDHRVLDGALLELAHQRGNLAARRRHVLLGRRRIRVLRPADHGHVLHVDQILGVQLLQPENRLIGSLGTREPPCRG